jgi:hypothetical protein
MHRKITLEQAQLPRPLRPVKARAETPGFPRLTTH